MLFVILIGNIGTGKSSFVKQLNRRNKKVFEIDEYAKHTNFDEKMGIEIKEAIQNKLCIIIDGTNLTRYNRSELIKTYYNKYSNYQLIAIDFGKGNEITLQRRLADPRGKSQEYWLRFHYEHFEDYQEPGYSEFFVKIYKKIDY